MNIYSFRYVYVKVYVVKMPGVAQRNKRVAVVGGGLVSIAVSSFPKYHIFTIYDTIRDAILTSARKPI